MTLAGYDSYKTRATEDQESVGNRDEEYIRDKRWADFIMECREFAKAEKDGYAAVVMAVSYAMRSQETLWR